MPFSNKKYKESKHYDVNPIILPVFHEPDDNDGNHGDDDDLDMSSSHNHADNDVVLSMCVCM